MTEQQRERFAVTRRVRAACVVVLVAWVAGCVPRSPSAPAAPRSAPLAVAPTASTRPPDAEPCVPAAVMAQLFEVPAREPATGDPTPWPRPSRLVDPRPLPVRVPAGAADVAALAQRDDRAAALGAEERAVLAAADAAFEAGARDARKLAAARKGYQRLLARPAGAAALEGYVRIQLARTHWLLGAPADARVELLKVLPLGDRALAAEALGEIVAIDARHADPATAYAALRSLSGAEPDADGRALELLQDVAREALHVGELDRARALYEDLAARDASSDRTCGYETARATAAVTRTPDPGQVLTATKRLVAAERAFAAAAHPEASLARCASETIAVVAGEAARLQVESSDTRRLDQDGQFAAAGRRDEVGRKGLCGTRDQRAMTIARFLDRMLIDTFGEAGLARAATAAPSDLHPRLADVTRASADLAYLQRDLLCARYYEDLLAQQPTASDVVEIVYRAAACHLMGTERDSLPAHVTPAASPGLDSARTARLAAIDRYLRLGEPPRSAARPYFAYVDGKHLRARELLATGQWPEAAAALRDLAFHHPDHVDAPRAGLLYLETLGLLAQTRPACQVDAVRDAAALHAIYCRQLDPQHGDWVPAGHNLARICADIRTFAPDAVPAPLHVELPALPPKVVAWQPQLHIDTTELDGNLPLEIVEARARAQLGSVIGCYELGLRRDPLLEGRVQLRFLIGRDGAVADVRQRASEGIAQAGVADCVVGQMRAFSYPPPEGGSVWIEYSLGFSRALGVIPPQPDEPVRKLRWP